MKRTFFRNSIIFSSLIIFIVSIMSIGYAALSKELSISSNATFLRGPIIQNNAGDPTHFLGCQNILSSSVKKIYFRNYVDFTPVETCDASEAQDGSVMVYLKSNGTVFVVNEEYGIVFSNTTTKFSGLVNCNYISFVDTNGKLRFSTKNLTGMYRMFDSLCSSSTCSMTKLDLTSFDTSNVTHMGGAFVDAKNVQEIDVSTFDTSKVDIMYQAFYGCESITNLNLSSWDTSKVYAMNNMFSGATSLSHIYVSSLWSTYSVINPPDYSSQYCNSEVGSCNGNEMFLDTNLYAAHPYSECRQRHHQAIDYAKIDGGSSSPGCLDDVANMP